MMGGVVDFLSKAGTSMLEAEAGTATEKVPTIAGDEDFAKLKPGQKFIDPEGKQRVKPYEVKTDADFSSVPEGAQFTDPEGQTRQKPSFGGIGFTAQTLYDMAVTDKERRKALERSYPGKVKADEHTGELYVDDDGQMLKPGHGMSPVPAGLASMALPTVGAVVGAVGGGAAAAPTGPGAVAGAVAGGVGGSLIGQGFNDAILQLAGVYDRTPGEELTQLGLAAASGGAGAGVGRGIGAIAPALKGAVTSAGGALPGMARHFVGTTPEDLGFARQLADKGALVPPSSWAKEAPHIQNIVEVFEPAFHTQDPLLQSATGHYERSAGELLEGLGVKTEPGQLVKPSEAVATQATGEALLRKTLTESQAADAEMRRVLDARKAAVEGREPGAMRVYHGTDADVSSGLSGDKARGSHEAGAVFMTPDRGLAELYGKNIVESDVVLGKTRTFDILDMIKNDPAFMDEIKRSAEEMGTRNDYLKGRAATPEGRQALDKQWKDFEEKLRRNAEAGHVRFDGRITGAINNIAKREGLDTAVVRNMAEGHGKPSEQVMVFNPKNIKAAGPKAEERVASQREALQKAAENARTQAQALVDAGYQEIQRGVDTAMQVARAGHGTGELWQSIGEQLRAVRRGIQERASTMYGQADELAAGHLPNVEGLPEIAQRFADELPEEFQRNQPAIVRQLRQMAGERNPETGEVTRPPSAPTFGQLHNLRSQIRQSTDFYRLNSDIKNGTFKFFARRVDEVLHDPQAVPELRAAAEQLDRADAFYRENMPIFEAQQIKTIMKGLEAGEPADPKVLYRAVVKEGHTDLTNRIREMVGPNLWAGVRAADVQEIMDASRSLVPGQVDGRAFTREVLERYRSGILQSVHGPDVTARLLRQAQDVAMLEGRLPVAVRPGDTLTQAIDRAQRAAQEAKTAAKQDPLATLSREVRKIEVEGKREAAAARGARRAEPLGFLYEPTTGAAEAVDRILKSEDLILASAAKFGEGSPEFNMLRQTWAQRLLQGTLQPGERLAKTSAEVQRIMFPGVTLEQAHLLAREMDFLMANRYGMKGTAQGMSAMAKVENPWAHIAGRGGTIGKIIAAPINIIPGSGAAGRFILGEYYALIRKLATSPATLRWLERGLTGDPEQKAAARTFLQRYGAAMGAGAGEAMEQRPRQ